MTSNDGPCLPPRGPFWGPPRGPPGDTPGGTPWRGMGACLVACFGDNSGGSYVRFQKTPSTGHEGGEYPFARLINKHLRFIRRTGSTRKLTGSISGSAGCFSPGSLHRGFFLLLSRVCASEVSGRADPADFPEAPRKHTGSTPEANTPDVTDDPEWVGGRAEGGDMSAHNCVFLGNRKHPEASRKYIRKHRLFPQKGPCT